MGSIFWFTIFIILLGIELVTVNLVTVWFATGAFVSFAISLFVDNLFWEVFAFILVSAITLLLTRPIFTKFWKKEKIPMNSDRIVGKCGLVLRKIQKFQPGEVKVLGTIWTAVSDNEIEEGDEVRILEIDGVKVKVEKVNQKEE